MLITNKMIGQSGWQLQNFNITNKKYTATETISFELNFGRH